MLSAGRVIPGLLYINFINYSINTLPLHHSTWNFCAGAATFLHLKNNFILILKLKDFACKLYACVKPFILARFAGIMYI